MLPCASCPWRVDQDASVIPGYNQGKACNLMNTVGNSDNFRPMMACHGSTEEEPRICNGYLAREGWTNINVRILLARRKVPNPNDVLRACKQSGIELHQDYASVLAKLSRTEKQTKR